MKRQILEKLDNSLRNFKSEADVVYILTRIGKILEIDEKKQDYPVINFYRNWSVHKQIDDVGNVRHYLEDFIHNKENRDSLLFHKPLFEELNLFSKNYSVSNLSGEQAADFAYLLGKVISDTPVFIKFDRTHYEISISEPVSRDQSGTYKISVKVSVEPVKMKITIPPVEAKYEGKVQN